MSFSTLLSYIRSILSHVPLEHWVVIVFLSIVLAILLLIRKKCSAYGAITLTITVFIGLFLLDASVYIRYSGLFHHLTGFGWKEELNRLLHPTEIQRASFISNFVVFVPFGLFLSESLSVTKRFSAWRRIGLATLAGFGLSMCIECLQLVLRVGFFEVTDLVMNTLGAVVGAGIASIGRKIVVSLGR